MPRPPSPPVGWGLWSFWLAPPRLCGAVCSTKVWYGCCRLLAVMSSLRARYHTKYDVALFSLANGPPVPADAVLRSVKKHWLRAFSIVLPPSGLRGFVPVVAGRGRGAGGGYHGGRGGWGAGTREHIWCSAARPPLPPPPHGIPPPPCGSLWCGFPPAPPHCGCGRLRPLPWLLLVGRLASGC